MNLFSSAGDELCRVYGGLFRGPRVLISQAENDRPRNALVQTDGVLVFVGGEKNSATQQHAPEIKIALLPPVNGDNKGLRQLFKNQPGVIVPFLL